MISGYNTGQKPIRVGLIPLFWSSALVYVSHNTEPLPHYWKDHFNARLHRNTTAPQVR